MYHRRQYLPPVQFILEESAKGTKDRRQEVETHQLPCMAFFIWDSNHLDASFNVVNIYIWTRDYWFFNKKSQLYWSMAHKGSSSVTRSEFRVYAQAFKYDANSVNQQQIYYEFIDLLLLKHRKPTFKAMIYVFKFYHIIVSL